ncbi:MAG: ribosomal protein S18-alanine N-acetyltransferase [Proteobacteria bacterium]|nr:ribosomal protein S18-alanine N-acetyltransferase [Pseudomonadota bacterium]
MHTRLRPMTAADLPTVLATEAVCYPEPWSQRLFEDCIEARSKGYRCHMLLLEDASVGHAVLTLIADEAELLNFCLHPSHQARGLAGVFLAALIAELSEQGAAKIFLEVRRSNAPARRLYRAAGLQEIGVRKNYYPAEGGREDAVLMGADLISAAS